MTVNQTPDRPSSNAESLRQSEERFRLLVEGVKDYAIFLLDPDGFISSWNSGAERIKGYSADEIIGRHFSTFYPAEVVANKWPDRELEIARQEGRYEEEGIRVRKDGSTFWANVVITALYDPDGTVRGFAKVTRDLSERKRIEALESSERRMTEFLAMLSHELRNPLAPIYNAVYLLHSRADDDPDLKWAIDLIDRQVTHLTRLVDDLMEVGRVTSGSIRLQKKDFDIRSLITPAVESSRPLLDARKHTIELSIPERELIVHGDPTRLTQVVVNLLNNAAKYTPEGGRISLSLVREGNMVEIRIRDSGVGIQPEFLTKIFDMFTQGERTLDRSEGGLGIGLTLVRRLIQMHDGTVDASSEGPGKGSLFVVRLPLVDAPSADQPTLDTARDLPLKNGAGGLRVLVVDDNQDAATSMTVFLKMWGYDVKVVHDGIDAIDAVVEYRPEIVLLDIGLPGMDGYEVAERIRRMDTVRKPALIALTGYGQEADRSHTRRSGFDYHLVKPVAPESLKSLLATVGAARNAG